MDIVFLFVPFVLFLMFSVLSFMDKKIFSGIVFCLLLFFTIFWVTLFISATRVIDYQNIYKVESVGHGVNRMQIIVILEENMRIINVNDLLGRTFPDGCKIKRTVYKRNYYGLNSMFEKRVDYEPIIE